MEYTDHPTVDVVRPRAGLTWLGIGLGMVPLAVLIFIVQVFYLRVMPIGDELILGAVMGPDLLSGTFHVTDLFEKYGSHRPFSINLVTLISIWLTGWNIAALQWLSVSLAILVWSALTALTWQWEPRITGVAAPLLALGVFSLGQEDIWLLTHNFAWWGIWLFFLAGLWAVLHAHQPNWGTLLLAAVDLAAQPGGLWAAGGGADRRRPGRHRIVYAGQVC